MTSQSKENHKKGNINIIAIIIAIMLALLLFMSIVIVVLLLREGPQEDDDVRPGIRGTIVTQDNVEELPVDEGVIQDGYYDVSMSLDWHFKGGVTKDAKVANKTTNTRTVYFDLLTEGTEELVYSSPYIRVGESMQGFSLNKELEPGTYDMIVRYYLVDDDNAEVSNVSVGLTIYVE